MIVQRLREIQNRFGFLPDIELKKLAEDSGVALARIEEVSSFFPAFILERSNPPTIEMRVCRDMTCHLRGSADLLNTRTGLPVLAEELSRQTGEKVCVEGVSCLGRCDRAPVVWVEKRHMPEHEHAWVYTNRPQAELEDVLRKLAVGKEPPPADPDAKYEPHTNRPYALPVFTEGEHPPLRAAGWSLDVYGRQKWPRDYRAVKRFTDYLENLKRPLLPPPRGLGSKEVDAYIQKYHPLLWELKNSTLLGMGGAGTPAYKKWLDVWRAESEAGPEKYIVCNGDESEPGTFKDRELLLRTPHLVVEGVILAGLMTGATTGYIYIRHEYFEQIHAVREEIMRAERLNACGENIFNSGRNFPVEVFESPGGYICGEQSALIEAMEDRRGQPRNRPPELSANGLRDRPTVVNNVETLAWTPAIILFGGGAYERGGWRLPPEPTAPTVPATAKPDDKVKMSGRRLFSISGDVKRPGVYEVPIGLPLGDLLTLDKYCDGVINGPLRAVATSGPSGGLLPAKLPVDPKFDEAKRAAAVAKIASRSATDGAYMEWFLKTHLPLGATHLDLTKVPLDLTFYRNMESTFRLPVEPMLGAALVVYAGNVDILDQAVNFTEFYRNESCGKCVPCRLGSQKLVQIGADLLARRERGAPPVGAEAADVKKDVEEITKTLKMTSICGLGYVAPFPLATALAYFATDMQKKPGT